MVPRPNGREMDREERGYEHMDGQLGVAHK
jgi:hypothetical protein